MHAAWRLLRAAAALIAVGLVVATPAFAGSSFDMIFHEYQSTGKINACQHSTADLQAAKNQVPPDLTQYGPDFPVAIQGALDAHAHGDCGGSAAAGGSGSGGSGSGGSGSGGSASGGSGSPSSGGSTSGTGSGTASDPFGSPITQAANHAGGGGASGVSVPLIILIVVLVALALAGAAWWMAKHVSRGGPRGSPSR